MKTIRSQRNGSEISSSPGLLQMVMSTNEASLIFEDAISEDTSNVISSPALPVGASPFVSPDGRKTKKSGPAPVPANPSPQREKLVDWATSGTFGLLSGGSSPSDDLQRSLANRLRARMDVGGSPEYALTWKETDMPSGPPICALRASARPTSDNGFSGWPTPSAHDDLPQSPLPEHLNYYMGRPSPRIAAAIAGWPTPQAHEFETSPLRGWQAMAMGYGNTLGQLVGWATPSARDWKNGQASDETMNRNARPLNEMAVQLAGWPTPTNSGITKGESRRTIRNRART